MVDGKVGGFEINTNKSGSLAAIRDALLPKLLFGKIRVNDAEQYSVETLEQ